MPGKLTRAERETIIRFDEAGETAEFPKKLITLRSKTVKKELTEEQRQKLTERILQNQF